MEEQLSESILDKVMAASKEEELSNFNPQETVAFFFSGLSDRERDVLRRRFGLNGKASETLEEIGKSYNVTRERVRQIENASIKNIKSSAQFDEMITPVEQVVQSALETHGGIMAEDHMLEYLLERVNDAKEQQAHLLFLIDKLTSDRIVREHPQDKHPSWKLALINWDKTDETVNAIINILNEHTQPLDEEALLARFKKSLTYQSHKQHYSIEDEDMDLIVYAHVRTSTNIRTNPFNEWGLAHWSTVSPKRMGDKIYLVLKKHGKPMHFRDITEMINTAAFDRKKAYAPTVHNELILDDRYVLVGRGIYALKEWGYVPGVVSDVITEILKESVAPLSRDEIVEKVLEQRMVKKGTVYLALASNSIFHKDEHGRFCLKLDV